MAKGQKPRQLTYDSEAISNIIIAGGGNGAKQTHRAVQLMPKVVGGKFSIFNSTRGFNIREIQKRIVGVANGGDDGGSTGILRDEFGILPPPGIVFLISSFVAPTKSCGSKVGDDMKFLAILFMFSISVSSPAFKISPPFWL